MTLAERLFRPLPLSILFATLFAAALAFAQLERSDERGVAPIDGSGSYEVDGIQVDTAARTADQARSGGWREAQRKGWKMLWARVNGKLSETGLTPFTTPRGGMFSWARLDGCDLSAREIADRARQKGIWLAPGEFFHLTPPDEPWFRFNVAYADAAELYEFFRTL